MKNRADAVAVSYLISVGNAAGTVAEGWENLSSSHIFDNNNLEIALWQERLADVVAMGSENAYEGIETRWRHYSPQFTS